MTQNNHSRDHIARLIGWLVSYEHNQLGESFEIRAGRTLVSSEDSEGERTLTLEADDICSPHSAMRASSTHRVMVQDVFSTHGTFVTRGGSRNEEKVSGPIEVKHGDWLRFGQNVKYQVCLIEAPVK